MTSGQCLFLSLFDLIIGNLMPQASTQEYARAYAATLSHCCSMQELNVTSLAMTMTSREIRAIYETLQCLRLVGVRRRGENQQRDLLQKLSLSMSAMKFAVLHSYKYTSIFIFICECY